MNDKPNQNDIAIIGGGNIGKALVGGFLASKQIQPSQLYVTRRRKDQLADLEELGVQTGSDNRDAVCQSDVVIISLQPPHVQGVLEEICDVLEPGRHIVCCVATAVSCADIEKVIGIEIPIFMVMPNTAAGLTASMTCIATHSESAEARQTVERLFDFIGKTLFIDEEMIPSATVLAACGIAYALRFIRAASQGGIEIGFHAEEALTMAAQTVKGAAVLLLAGSNHPEQEIDKVTTPQGCTIAGLNEMEHRGFSSALIKGIITSKQKISTMTKK